MTTQEFNTSFKPFLDYFPSQDMTKARINIYCLALSQLTAEQLQKAFISMVQNRVYKNYPQVAEILQYATGTTENDLNSRIVIAKQILKNAVIYNGAYSSVEFEDKAIHAVIDSVGGWQKLCLMASEDFEALMTFEFKKIYEAYARHNYAVSQFYLGIHDMTNKTCNVKFIGFSGMGKTGKVISYERRAIENKTGIALN